jgi:predicted transcriptional regulator
MSTITIRLDDDRLARFREPAEVLGVAPEELARIAIEEFLARPDEEFDRIIDDVLRENAELLRRLAR